MVVTGTGTMIKKEYQKPTMNVVQLKTQGCLLTMSQVESTGLGGTDKLNYNGEDGDMEDDAW